MSDKQIEIIDTMFSQIQVISENIWGNHEFGYRKQLHRWHSSRGSSRGYYSTSVLNSEIETTSSEYNLNVERGKHDSSMAFFSKKKGDYWTYHTYIKKIGWQEKLNELFNQKFNKKEEL